MSPRKRPRHRQRRLVNEHFRYDGKPKKPFKTKEEAENFLLMKNFSDQYSYQCSICGLYHLAHIRPEKGEK